MFVIYVCFVYFTLTGGYENLALHKPAYQLYPYKKSFESQADAAVDGLKNNTAVWGDQCVISEKGKYIALWWVNLTRISSIHHIIVYYVTGRKKWGPNNNFAKEFLGFSIYVSNTTEKEDGILCFKDKNSTVNDISPVFNITCLVQGQYVIYYNERKRPMETSRSMSEHAFNDLCEVEVYGCPDPEYYGNDCSKRCHSSSCKYCHIERGTCLACKPGFQGQECKIACDHEMCGDNHNQLCEHCLHPSSCSHVDGICENGCEAGYHGRLCDTKCDIGFHGPNCKWECSRTCKIPRKCNHITGACDDGCQPDWQGLECTDIVDRITLEQIYWVVLVAIASFVLVAYPCLNLLKIVKRRMLAYLRRRCRRQRRSDTIALNQSSPDANNEPNITSRDFSSHTCPDETINHEHGTDGNSNETYAVVSRSTDQEDALPQERNECGSDKGFSTYSDLDNSDEERESNDEEIKEEMLVSLNECGSDKGVSTHNDLDNSDEETESNDEENTEETRAFLSGSNTHLMKKDDKVQKTPCVDLSKQVNDSGSSYQDEQSIYENVD